MSFHRVRQSRFSVLLKTQDGNKFWGEFQNPNSYPRPRKEIQNLPHRGLVTGRKSVAKAGDLVTAHGQHYLLAGQHVMQDVNRFLAVEINMYLSWRRFNEIVDPVTGMSKDQTEVTLDDALPITLEPHRSIEEENFTRDQYRFLTAADVREGDKIGDMTVINTVDLFGLVMAEAS